MTQTITNVTSGASSAPEEVGVPRLLSSYDFEADAAAVLADEGSLVSLRVELNPIINDHTSEAAPDSERLISAGFAGTDYRSALSAWPTITRQSAKEGVVGGGTGNTVGALAVVNERTDAPNLEDADDYDGQLDTWVNEYVWDQKPVTLSAVARAEGDITESFSVPVPLIVARTTKISNVSRTAFTIELGDLIEQLGKRVQTVRLRGTGGDEGGPELLGVRPPIVMGSPLNMTGLLVTSTPNPTYLVHRDSQGHSIQGVSAVYIGGNVVSPGNYVVTTGVSNTVRITTALDETKQVTFDVVGPLECGTAVSDFMRFLLTDIGPLNVTDLDQNMLAIFRALAPYAAGWMIGPDDSYVKILNDLTQPWAWWGPNALGKIVGGLMVDPDLDFTDYTLPTHAITSVLPIDQVNPLTAVATGYAKNWNQVTEDQVADAARSTERGKWSQQPHYRIADASDQALIDLYPGEGPPQDYETPFLESSEAQIVHWRNSLLLGGRWRPYQIIADARAVRFEANRVVEFAWPRWTGNDEPLAYRIQSIEVSQENGGLSAKIVAWRMADTYVLGGDDDEEYLMNAPGEAMRVR
jgi:hypothetical protein